MVPLLGLSLFLGFYPQPVLDRLQPSVNALIAQVEAHSNYRQPSVAKTGPVAATTSSCAAAGQAREVAAGTANNNCKPGGSG